MLVLVAGGATNREVAERLFISQRTVDKHVERLLQKTGTTPARSRRDRPRRRALAYVAARALIAYVVCRCRRRPSPSTMPRVHHDTEEPTCTTPSSSGAAAPAPPPPCCWPAGAAASWSSTGPRSRATSCPATPSSPPAWPAWQRWGLLDRVRATGVPFASNVRFDFGDVVLEGAAGARRRDRRPPSASAARSSIRCSPTPPPRPAPRSVTASRSPSCSATATGWSASAATTAPAARSRSGRRSSSAPTASTASSPAPWTRPTYHVQPGHHRHRLLLLAGPRPRSARALRPARPVLRRHADQRRAHARGPAGARRRGRALPAAGSPTPSPRRWPRCRAWPTGSRRRERVERFRCAPPARRLLPAAGRSGLGARRRRRLPQGPDHRPGDARRLPRRRAARPDAVDDGLDGDLGAAMLPATSGTATPRPCRCTSSPAAWPTSRQPPSAEMQALLAALAGTARPHRPVPRRHRRLGPDPRVLQPARASPPSATARIAA